jgi:hypothetical protein
MAMRNRRFYQGQATRGKYKTALRGKYYLSHPEKNLRGSKYILFKSKLEAMFIRYLDNNPDVLKWDYENPMNTIPYFDPVQQRQRHYIVDFVMWVRSGPTTQEVWVEIKSSGETQPPKKGRNTIAYNESVRTYATNMAKWKMAAKICQAKGKLFRVITEKELIRKV